MTRLLSHPEFVAGACERHGAMFALIAGSNYGANFTFLGALAGIMWSKILRTKGVNDITFWRFVKYGLIIMPLVVGAGCLVLAIEMNFVCSPVNPYHIPKW